MEIELIGSTEGYRNLHEFLRFSQACGRQCYSSKDFSELKKEPYKTSLIERMLKNGHHSVFEHVTFNFSFKKIPKILAMVLNNEKQYVTSEKSARYTIMKDIKEEQRKVYDKWMEKFMDLIDKVYPKNDLKEEREMKVKKLSQENARYMTSVFTPTNMVHTLNLRQLNFIIYEFEDFIQENKKTTEKNEFKKRLADAMEEFVELTKNFKVNELKNMTARKLSFFGKPVEVHFGDTYSVNYLMSFAGFAQAQRHRTLNYQVTGGYELKAPFGFFVPEILPENLKKEWVKDLERLAKEDFPQAQLIRVSERGLKEDFRSKLILRLCGHAQYEIMKTTLEIGKRYAKADEEVGKWLKPKCMQGMECNERCIWGGKEALKRKI